MSGFLGGWFAQKSHPHRKKKGAKRNDEFAQPVCSLVIFDMSPKQGPFWRGKGRLPTAILQGRTVTLRGCIRSTTYAIARHPSDEKKTSWRLNSGLDPQKLALQKWNQSSYRVGPITSYKWSYNPYKGPYRLGKWGFFALLLGGDTSTF